MSEADKKRRQQAAAAREAATAGEKKRERTVRIVGAVTVAVVVLGIVGVAFVAKQGSSNDAAAIANPTENSSAAAPSGALPSDDEHAYGIAYGTAAADAPVLAIWEDFQCPACGSVEQANGAGIAALAEAGKVQLVWRPTTFLDKNLGNDASNRAVAAWGCAVDAGKAREFHDIVYANQPETEGDGFTDEQLLAFAGDAGITGAELDTFTTCVSEGTYRDWAGNSTARFYADGVQGTPFATLDGVEVPIATLADAAALEQFVADAVSGAGAEPAASPSASAS